MVLPVLTIHRRSVIIAAGLVAVAILWAPVVRSASVGVEIVDFAYAPAAVTVHVGDTVTWTNRDAVEHTVTSDPGAAVAFDSGLFGQQQTFSMTFTQPGTYGYHCTPHPTMVGAVTVLPAVQPSSAPPPTPAASGAVSDTAVGKTDATPAGALLGIMGLAMAGLILLRLRRTTRG